MDFEITFLCKKWRDFFGIRSRFNLIFSYTKEGVLHAEDEWLLKLFIDNTLLITQRFVCIHFLYVVRIGWEGVTYFYYVLKRGGM